MPADAPVIAFIALGANLGDRAATIARAIDAIDALPLTRVTVRSSLYRSAPIDAGGPDYLNAVVAVETGLSGPGLLARLQRIETLHGRQRPHRNAPRTLDLDIVLFGDQPIATPELTVPHPRYAQRAFVLLPLAEIAPARVSAAQLDAVAGQRIERLPAAPVGPVAAARTPGRRGAA